MERQRIQAKNTYVVQFKEGSTTVGFATIHRDQMKTLYNKCKEVSDQRMTVYKDAVKAEKGNTAKSYSKDNANEKPSRPKSVTATERGGPFNSDEAAQYAAEENAKLKDTSQLSSLLEELGLDVAVAPQNSDKDSASNTLDLSEIAKR